MKAQPNFDYGNGLLSNLHAPDVCAGVFGGDEQPLPSPGPYARMAFRNYDVISSREIHPHVAFSS